MERIIYQLTVKDIQNVAEQELERKLSNDEIALLENRIAENIPWYDAIADAIKAIIEP